MYGTTLTPDQITADEDDYTPTGVENAAGLRLSSDASRNITGLFPGREKRIYNVGAQDIVLTNEDAASTDTYRFLFGADVTLGANEGISVWYDEDSERWRSAGKHV